MENELLKNIEKLHTTELGVERIKRNVQIDVEDVVHYCAEIILKEDSVMERKGKNWYIYSDMIQITVNAYSYTIITAHR